MLTNAHIPILGFAAYSGAGKTTLLVKLLSLYKQQGLKVGIVKHSHHRFDIDYPGKDSYELRKAGAAQTLIGSRWRWALVAETRMDDDVSLDDLLTHLDQNTLDFILVEGFKQERLPKIELCRPSLGNPLLFPDDPSIIAVASDGPLPYATQLPLLDLNRTEQIAQFVIDALFDNQVSVIDAARERSS